MKHISKNSQKGMNYLHSFEMAKAKDIDCLEKVYGRYSHAKGYAFYQCEKTRQNEGGQRGYIIGANSSFFTYAFETAEGLRVETACNSFIIY